MAAEIPNLVKRNGIYYFRCRIPSILTNGRAREVKISLKTGNLTSDRLDVIVEVSDYSRRVIAETVKSHNQGGATDMNIVTEIRNRITQYINTSLIDQEVYDCEYGATCNASKAEGRKMMLNVCNSVENALKDNTIPSGQQLQQMIIIQCLKKEYLGPWHRINREKEFRGLHPTR